MSQPEIRKRKTFPLRLSKLELLHLRDLFSIKLPLELKQTVSQALAEGEARLLVEAKLWLKVADACKEAELPLDDEAPDFVVMASAQPPVSVYRMAHDPDENEAVPEEGNDPFGGDAKEE